MPLIASVSGIRGVFGDGLDPASIVNYASAYGTWLREVHDGKITVVVGRDARVTGEVCADLVMSTLQGLGIDIVSVGMTTTPTVAMAVLAEKAQGGIILSASHNPAQWNALKLLNHLGEFLNGAEGQRVLDLADKKDYPWIQYEELGAKKVEDYIARHIEDICELSYIDPESIKAADFRVAVDAINSSGSISIVPLLERLGVKKENIFCINDEPNGRFAHNPEPLPENLGDISKVVAENNCDLGIVVDPDVDRLALVADGGVAIGEEMTQVITAQFVWSFREGAFVTNLSSSRMIEDLAKSLGQEVYRSAVGEINVVELMKEKNATLGGEGNGGVILPDLHYGRDGLIGTAFVLQHMVNTGKKISEMVSELPSYEIVKQKIQIGDSDPDKVIAEMKSRYLDENYSDVDGLKIDFPNAWVHMRKSNTEPIIRVYSEAPSKEEATEIGRKFMDEISSI